MSAIAIYYEHLDWFRPLFGELERRGIVFDKIDAAHHRFDPSDQAAGGHALVFNRMSPSAWQRGLGHTIFYTLSYLAQLEAAGIRVINGMRAFAHEISKARQLTVLQSLGLPYPRAIVINEAAAAVAAAETIGYPLVVKPNIGGSGAGIERFDSAAALRLAVDENRLMLGIDQTALVQAHFTARDNVIMRVEVLGGKFLYAIRIHLTGDTFNLCPADICQDIRGQKLARTACALDAPTTGLKVEGFSPAPDVIADVERMMAAMGIDVGGVEYVVDDHTGQRLYYDVNALSNFVADAENVIGFNPHARLVDYLLAEARRTGS